MVLDFSRRLRKIAEKGIDEVREKLPLSRGGKAPDKEFIAHTITPVYETAEPLPITRRTPESFIPITPPIPTMTTEVPKMNMNDIIREVVNNPLIEITESMLPIINDPSMIMNSNGEIMRNQFAEQFRRDIITPRAKRKVSKYQKELGRQLKMLKKKHPRTKVTALMKRAHRLTRKALK